MGKGELLLYINGMLLMPDYDYIESSSTTAKLIREIANGQVSICAIVIRGVTLIEAQEEIEDSQISFTDETTGLEDYKILFDDDSGQSVSGLLWEYDSDEIEDSEVQFNNDFKITLETDGGYKLTGLKWESDIAESELIFDEDTNNANINSLTFNGNSNLYFEIDPVG